MPSARDKDDAAQRVAEIAGECFMVYIERLIEHLRQSMPPIISEAIIKQYAGQRIPKGTAARRQIRNKHIREQAAAGRDVAVLAVAFRLSPGQIRNILRQPENESD